MIAWVYLIRQPASVGRFLEFTAQAQSGEDLDLQLQPDNHLYFSGRF
ncbi:MAG: hypothetical protein NT154_06175 [Verrucomicrobia bacterium]|nr:hypothetical protein [Verrucomicrobiota bacterium]